MYITYQQAVDKVVQEFPREASQFHTIYFVLQRDKRIEKIHVSFVEEIIDELRSRAHLLKHQTSVSSWMETMIMQELGIYEGPIMEFELTEYSPSEPVDGPIVYNHEDVILYYPDDYSLEIYTRDGKCSAFSYKHHGLKQRPILVGTFPSLWHLYNGPANTGHKPSKLFTDPNEYRGEYLYYSPIDGDHIQIRLEEFWMRVPFIDFKRAAKGKMADELSMMCNLMETPVTDGLPTSHMPFIPYV